MIKALGLTLAMTLLLTSCMSKGAANLSRSQQKLADLQERAQISADKGQYDLAGRLLQEALQLASSRDDRQGQTTVLLQQARLARQQGFLLQAEQTLAQALQLSTNSPHYADAAQEKAIQELTANRLEAAQQWAETALRAEQGGLLARRLNLLARLALIQDRADDADRLAKQALGEASADTLATERANALRILGIVRGRQKQFAEGEELLGQALQLDKELELPSRIADDLEALAVLAGLRGDTTAQQQLQQRAQAVRAAMNNRAAPISEQRATVPVY